MDTRRAPWNQCDECGAIRPETELAICYVPNERYYCHGAFDSTPTCYERHLLRHPASEWLAGR